VELITSVLPWITNGPLILVQVMSGFSVGMFLFLLSVGMTLIFGVTRIVNLAHGSFYMVSAYLMVTLVELLPESPVSFWIALLLAPVGVAILGGVIEVTLLRRVYRRDPMIQLILTSCRAQRTGAQAERDSLAWRPATPGTGDRAGQRAAVADAGRADLRHGARERHALMALVAYIAADTGLTVLFTEHDMDVVFSVARRITVMHQGAVLAEGAPQEIRLNPEVQRVYLGYTKAR